MYAVKQVLNIYATSPPQLIKDNKLTGARNLAKVASSAKKTNTDIALVNKNRKV
jgi:hypothetical protein